MNTVEKPYNPEIVEMEKLAGIADQISLEVEVVRFLEEDGQGIFEEIKYFLSKFEYNPVTPFTNTEADAIENALNVIYNACQLVIVKIRLITDEQKQLLSAISDRAFNLSRDNLGNLGKAYALTP